MDLTYNGRYAIKPNQPETTKNKVVSFFVEMKYVIKSK